MYSCDIYLFCVGCFIVIFGSEFIGSGLLVNYFVIMNISCIGWNFFFEVVEGEGSKVI